jgi:hypothetical protein
MSLPSDQPPPTSSPEKPKMSAEERRRRHADRLATIRLRMAISRELDDRGITTPAAIGAAGDAGAATNKQRLAKLNSGASAAERWLRYASTTPASRAP